MISNIITYAAFLYILNVTGLHKTNYKIFLIHIFLFSVIYESIIYLNLNALHGHGNNIQSTLQPMFLLQKKKEFEVCVYVCMCVCVCAWKPPWGKSSSNSIGTMRQKLAGIYLWNGYWISCENSSRVKALNGRCIMQDQELSS